MEQVIAAVFVFALILVAVAAVGFVVLLVWFVIDFLRAVWEQDKAS